MDAALRAGIEGTLCTLSTDLTAEGDAHSKLNRCHCGADQRSLNRNGSAARETVGDLRETERAKSDWRGGWIRIRRERNEWAISRLGDEDQARKEPKRRLHLSSEHLVAQFGKEINPYVASFRVASEDVEDECIGPS